MKFDCKKKKKNRNNQKQQQQQRKLLVCLSNMVVGKEPFCCIRMKFDCKTHTHTHTHTTTKKEFGMSVKHGGGERTVLPHPFFPRMIVNGFRNSSTISLSGEKFRTPRIAILSMYDIFSCLNCFGGKKFPNFAGKMLVQIYHNLVKHD